MSTQRGSIRVIVGVALSLLLIARPASAAFITFQDEITQNAGTGFGNVLGLLALQTQGRNTTEAGSVYWDGAGDVLDGDATPQSITQPVSALEAKGFDDENLIIVLNLNQTGAAKALDVHEFTMRFYIDPNGSQFFDAVYDRTDPRNSGSTLGLTPEGQGTGSAGYVFRITFEGNEAADFFGNAANRIGMAVNTAIDNEANDGPENFYVGDADLMETTPEPVTLSVLILGSLAILRRRP